MVDLERGGVLHPDLPHSSTHCLIVPQMRALRLLQFQQLPPTVGSVSLSPPSLSVSLSPPSLSLSPPPFRSHHRVLSAPKKEQPHKPALLSLHCARYFRSSITSTHAPGASLRRCPGLSLKRGRRVFTPKVAAGSLTSGGLLSHGHALHTRSSCTWFPYYTLLPSCGQRRYDRQQGYGPPTGSELHKGQHLDNRMKRITLILLFNSNRYNLLCLSSNLLNSRSGD